MSASELGTVLRLEKSSVSRMLHKLVLVGDIVEQMDEGDGRAKRLFLTESGQARARSIHAFGRRQVATALARLEPGQDNTVLEGLQLYTNAFVAETERTSAPKFKIVQGYKFDETHLWTFSGLLPARHSL
ncbi:MarR family winged helix-turn-helix transcriptional regulator [Herbaspirillum camelliae]|uniref:MarR family winged helix-turn-helix transcriptional regulator n=1 Tax=Herbaspirillum camelliae TaxID=1892903 RepID=UPI000949C750|nr:MarR family winged helix-turn-helix transcriptional regulator [Herbaspirillum camelliae]